MTAYMEVEMEKKEFCIIQREQTKLEERVKG